MRRMNNLITLFCAMVAFFFGSFITNILSTIDKCPTRRSGIDHMDPYPETFLVVLVLTAPVNRERRQAMRDTWLRLGQPLMQPYFPEANVYLPQYDKRGFLQYQNTDDQRKSINDYKNWMDNVANTAEVATRRYMEVRHFFAIGTQNLDASLKRELHREHAEHKDLLLLPRLSDTYTNLTEKLLHAIDALTNHYSYSYMLKVDDDTYVKMDYLLNELVSYDRKRMRKAKEYRNQPLPELYWGYFHGRANIKTKGQWRETNYFLAQRYITYALGGGYVISRGIAEFIEANSHHLSTYVSEDVSLGTWLSPLRHVYRWHDVRFDTGYMPRACRRHHLVLHKRNETQIRDLYGGKLCNFEMMQGQKQQYGSPIEYFYDWQKPADKCCDTKAL